jgi:nitrate reductase alpha subunit
MPFAEKKWMELEIVMLSKISQTKDKYYMLSVMWNLEKYENRRGTIREKERDWGTEYRKKWEGKFDQNYL